MAYHKKPGDPCPYCERILTENFFFKKSLQRRQRIRKALRETTVKTGRPRTINYEEVYCLRDRGFSHMDIAAALGAKKGAVQYALKQRSKENGRV